MIFLTVNVPRLIPANVNEVLVEAFTDSLTIIYIFIINKQLRRKAIDFTMLHDRVHTRRNLFYVTIIEKIKAEFPLSDSDDLIKSISEYDTILFM